MYRCDFCNKNSNPGESCNIIVTKRRKKTYNNGNNFTQGWEIVEEKRTCANCFKKRNQFSDYVHLNLEHFTSNWHKSGLLGRF